MISNWLGTSWTQAWLVVVSSVGIFLAVITYTRIAGLRSFSKMSSFDFAMTVAIGSLMATVSVTSSSLSNGIIALGSLYGVQTLIAAGRRRWGLDAVVDNEPLLLMDGPDMLDENLKRARITESDVIAKLREANVLHFGAVHAVVLETTGDISVLHGEGEFDDALIAGVRR